MLCSFNSRSLLVSLLALVLSASTASSQSTTYTWTGGDPVDNGWFEALNWSAVGPGSPPPVNNVNDTIIVLAGNIKTTNTLDYSFSANSLTFDAGAGAFTVGTTTAETLTLGIGGLTVASGNTNNQTFNANLALGAAQTWANNGTGVFSVGGGIDNGGFLLTADGSGNSSYSGVISGSGGLTKSGAGTLTLGGVNTFGGVTTVTAGTLSVSADTAFGAVPGATTAGKIILDGGTLSVTTGFALSTNRGVALGPTSGSGNGTISVASGQTLSYGGVIANNPGGTGGLIKTGAGTLTLSGTNTFSGPVAINGGVLSIGSTNQILPTSTATVTLDGGTLRHTSTGVGSTFINTNHPIVIGPGGGTIDIPSSAAILIYSPAANTILITPAVAGSGTITKSGAGTLRLSTSITTVAINTVQKLVVTGGLWQGGLDTVFGAVPTSPVADAISLNGGGLSSNAGLTLNVNRGITLGAAGGTINTSSGFTFSGKITGTGGLTKTGASSLVLGGAANDYAGGTTITAGTIQLVTGNNRLPTTGNLTFTGGTLDLNTRSQTINVLSSSGGAGTVTSVAAGSNGTLTVGNGNGSGTFSGVISQNGTGITTFIKTGAGTQTLTGTNTYTGATTINAGTLAIGTGGSLAAGSAVAVNNTGILAGTGTVNGAVAVNAGGAIRGDVTGATGTLTVNNNVAISSTVSSNGILQFEASRTGAGTANASLVSVTGATNILNLSPGIGNRFTIDLVNGTNTLQAGETYALTLATVATAGNIQLNGTTLNPNDIIDPSNYLLQSSAFSSFSGVSLAINGAGTGLVLTFSPVPEPATVLAIAAGALGLGGVVRRRFRRTSMA